MASLWNQSYANRNNTIYSLSDETLSCCPVFWDALKPEPLPVEPSGVPGQSTTKSINPPGQYWYSQGTRPQTRNNTIHIAEINILDSPAWHHLETSLTQTRITIYQTLKFWIYIKSISVWCRVISWSKLFDFCAWQVIIGGSNCISFGWEQCSILKFL